MPPTPQPRSTSQSQQLITQSQPGKSGIDLGPALTSSPPPDDGPGVGWGQGSWVKFRQEGPAHHYIIPVADLSACLVGWGAEALTHTDWPIFSGSARGPCGMSSIHSITYIQREHPEDWDSGNLFFKIHFILKMKERKGRSRGRRKKN